MNIGKLLSRDNAHVDQKPKLNKASCNFYLVSLVSLTDYTELGGDEELPLGQEFQSHINCFIQRQKKIPSQQYMLGSKLIHQLA